LNHPTLDQNEEISKSIALLAIKFNDFKRKLMEFGGHRCHFNGVEKKQ